MDPEHVGRGLSPFPWERTLLALAGAVYNHTLSPSKALKSCRLHRATVCTCTRSLFPFRSGKQSDRQIVCGGVPSSFLSRGSRTRVLGRASAVWWITTSDHLGATAPQPKERSPDRPAAEIQEDALGVVLGWFQAGVAKVRAEIGTHPIYNRSGQQVGRALNNHSREVRRHHFEVQRELDLFLEGFNLSRGANGYAHQDAKRPEVLFTWH